MFESEDFDLDEDFLKDIGEKEEEYYSQKPVNDANFEQRKTVVQSESDFSSDIIFDDEPDFAKISRRSSDSERASAEIVERSNEENSHRQSVRGASNIVEKRQKERDNRQNGRTNENAEISRRKLALEILRKGNGDRERKSPSPTTSRAKETSEVGESQRKSLLEIFKKPQIAKSKTALKSAEKASSECLPRERSAAIARVPLVRKFPGPAGLLPDGPEAIFEHGSSSNRADPPDVRAEDDDEDSAASEYFSQNTERLFSGGAWRLMLDDLPRDFLRGHEIATIKRTGRRNSRIKFLAGVVQRIDHSLDNPRFVLKDYTDTIEGTIHRDIPLQHPNVLEPGVVVFVRNAGLLGFQASPNFPKLEFHVMIAPRNVLAVYSEKGRLVTSEWLESMRNSREERREIDTRETKRNDDEGAGDFSKLPRETDENDAAVAEVNEVECTDVEIHRVEVPLTSGIKGKPEGRSEKIDVIERKGFGDNLLDSDDENDTEDEILSQLDVDSIVTSYDSSMR